LSIQLFANGQWISLMNQVVQKKKKKRQLEEVNLERDRFGHHDETDDSDEERTRKRVAAPSFTGHRVLTTHDKDANSTIRTSHQLFDDFQFQQNKLEKRFLQPLLVSIKRQSETLKEIIITQTKIIRGLRRRHIHVETNQDRDDEIGDQNDFKKELVYTSADGVVTDLLRREAHKATANRYVTWLIDIVFKPNELVAVSAQDLPQDHRYQLIKDAVKNKFHLTLDEMEQIWLWLHTVILAKRRTLDAKFKRLGEKSMNIN